MDEQRSARVQELRDAIGVAELSGAALRQARKELGLTQAELAALLDLSEKNGRQTIRRWEDEETDWSPPWTVAVTIAALLERARPGS